MNSPFEEISSKEQKEKIFYLEQKKEEDQEDPVKLLHSLILKVKQSNCQPIQEENNEKSFQESNQKNQNTIMFDESKNKDQLQEKAMIRAGDWLREEHQKFLRGLLLYGKNWIKIQNYLGTRSSFQIKSHAQMFKKKLNKKCPRKYLKYFKILQKKSPYHQRKITINENTTLQNIPNLDVNYHQKEERNENFPSFHHSIISEEPTQFRDFQSNIYSNCSDIVSFKGMNETNLKGNLYYSAMIDQMESTINVLQENRVYLETDSHSHEELINFTETSLRTLLIISSLIETLDGNQLDDMIHDFQRILMLQKNLSELKNKKV